MTATVNPGGTDVYVLVRCYTPDFVGEFVHVRYFPEDGDNSADISVLSSRLWPDSAAQCSAEGGYYTPGRSRALGRGRVFDLLRFGIPDQLHAKGPALPAGRFIFSKRGPGNRPNEAIQPRLRRR